MDWHSSALSTFMSARNVSKSLSRCDPVSGIVTWHVQFKMSQDHWLESPGISRSLLFLLAGWQISLQSTNVDKQKCSQCWCLTPPNEYDYWVFIIDFHISGCGIYSLYLCEAIDKYKTGWNWLTVVEKIGTFHVLIFDFDIFQNRLHVTNYNIKTR